jgi:muramoyltetrapeptide carboxypeptidase
VFRRYQRFAGSDAERIADVQDVASGRVPTPKVLMGMRGGYGAHRLLQHIDFASLGARMREHGTLFFGFSDVCALQLALLARGNWLSFAGPMVYSEFGKPVPSVYTMDSFIQCTTSGSYSVSVPAFQSRDVNLEGILWGGNLSVLAALVGSPYMPDIAGGILFLEDVGEQPYRIERMLQTLLLAGILQKQQAVILGDFRMGNIRDVYDSSYDLSAVSAAISRAARIPVLTGFPFGHISNKTTFPLGAQAKVRGNGNGGYSVTFSGYPTLDKSGLYLDSLLPQPDFIEGIVTATPEDKTDLE